MEVDQLAAELTAASCGKQFECCTSAEIMATYMGITHDGQPITTEAQCVDFTSAVFTTFAIAKYQTSIEQGRMIYDAAAAGDCVAAIEDASCAEYGSSQLASMSACRPFLLPQVADGGGCTQDYECTSDNCEGATNPIDGPSTDGACAPMPGDGEACDENCADGLYCDGDVCAPLGAIGDACNVRSACASDYCAANMCAEKPLTCDGM